MSYCFSKKLLLALVCPHDQGKLNLIKTTKENSVGIFEGELSCQNCQQSYFIKFGILYLLPEQGQINTLMSTEMQVRDKQTTEYDKRLATRYYKEIPSTLAILGDLRGKKLIEYGCGTGRLTEIISQSAELVLAVDFSLISLQLLADKLKGKENIGLVWADAVNFKTIEHGFDLALAAQVYEHITTFKQRQFFLNNAKQSLRLGASLIMSVYHNDRRRIQQKLSQEGRHQSGIFFHYFLPLELRQELSSSFVVKKLKLIDITLPGESQLHLSLVWAGRLSRVVENLPVLNKFGHLLLVRADRKI